MNCTQYVSESKEEYVNAPQWNEFFFIEKITGIDTPRADDSKKTIYDMGGKQVLSHTGKANTLSVANLHQGVYVVTAKIGNEIATGKVYKF